ncbi:MAG: DUF2252 domain-containing protein [Solirubrobacterales bacterium]|nr:DUF2252 domain-containing protein [Solirubrobacterales bacterium]
MGDAHRTVEERAARGRAARRAVPRSSHEAWERGADGPDPLAILRDEERTRVPELLPIRHERMAASPFAFFRGAAGIMAADLAGGPVSGLRVQACGDAHLANFGVFAAPDRRLVFDVNDFDETLRAPWEWDVLRLAASLAIVGRHRGLDETQRARIVRRAVETYRLTMRRLAEMRDLEVWYARVDMEDFLTRLRADVPASAYARAQRALTRARGKDSLRAFKRLTVPREDGDGVRLASDPPLLVPIAELAPGIEGEERTAQMGRLLSTYRASLRADVRHLVAGYRFVDLARKVVGVGSVGTRAWVLLLVGRDGDDPLFLQAKEAEASVLEPYAGASAYRHHGRRVVEGQRLMQAAGDILLGWVRTTGLDGAERDFYVRQLWDAKASADLEAMEPEAMELYGRLCAGTLARAHARSGDRVAIAAYLGAGPRFDEALAVFAERYADQNERDHAAFAAAVAHEAGAAPVAA